MGSTVSTPDAPTSPPRPMPPSRRPDAPTSPSRSPKPKRTWLTIENSPASEANTPSRGAHLKNKPFSDSPDGRYSYSRTKTSPAGIDSIDATQDDTSQKLSFDDFVDSINQVGQSAQSAAAIDPPPQPANSGHNHFAGEVEADANPTSDSMDVEQQTATTSTFHQPFRATLGGFVLPCCKLVCKPTGSNFSVSVETLRRMHKKCKCNTRQRVASYPQVESDLKLRMKTLLGEVSRSPTKFEEQFKTDFPRQHHTVRRNKRVCGNCGYVCPSNSPTNQVMDKHFKSGKLGCKKSDEVKSDTVHFNTQFNYCLPESIKSKIIAGTFKLPSTKEDLSSSELDSTAPSSNQLAPPPSNLPMASSFAEPASI